jgi:hypothetical protein
VESDIAQKIAGSLEAKLTGREQHGIASSGTNNSRAYDLYLRGLALRNSLTDADSQKRIDFFRRAVELDPRYMPVAGRCSRSSKRFYLEVHLMANKLRKTPKPRSRRRFDLHPIPRKRMRRRDHGFSTIESGWDGVRNDPRFQKLLTETQTVPSH